VKVTSITQLTARAPMLPAHVAHDLFCASDPLEATRDLLNASPMFDTALYLASKSLYDSLLPWRAGKPIKKRRAPLKALAYALRMSTRSTPFGLFARTGVVSESEATVVSIGSNPSSVFGNIDMAWISNLCAALERDLLVRDALPVVANDLIVVCGDRAYVRHPERLRRGDDPSDRTALHYETITLRWSETLQRVMALAEGSQPLGELVGTIAQALSMDGKIARELTERLLQIGALVFVRPIGSLGLEWLRKTLREADSAIANDLDDIARLTKHLGTHTAESLTSEHLSTLAAAFNNISSFDGSPLQINAVQTFDGSLPDRVLADVAELGNLLLANARPRPLDAYRDRFMQRYEGDSRKIPLLELVDPEIGLGVPEDTSRPRAERNSRGDEARMHLIARALRDRSLEVRVTPAERDRLIPPVNRVVSNGCEIGFQIAARDASSLDRGEYAMRPVYGINTDGPYKTTHRFAAGLGRMFIERMHAANAAHAYHGPLPVELVFTPKEAHYANLLQVPESGFAVASRREHLPDGVTRIEPCDILIGIEHGRFVAYSKKHARRLLVRESYMLQVPFFAPPHIRLLSLIGKQDHIAPRLFSWDGLSSSPFTPRVRSGRLVLAVARWSVSRAELEQHKDVGLMAYLQSWREQWNVPRWVYLVERDLKMLLDLDSPLAADLIADQMTNSNDGYPIDAVMHFEEMFPDFDHLWLTQGNERYFHEFVAAVSGEQATDVPSAPVRINLGRAKPYGPGSDWTFLKLYGPASEMDAMIRSVIGSLVAGMADCGVERFFFLRYADPDPHLRVRFHAPGRGGEVLTRVSTTLGALSEGGTIGRYTFDTYEPEIERYGGELGLPHAETLFAEDSARILDLMLAGELSTWEQRVSQSMAVLASLTHAWFERFGTQTWMQRYEKSARGTRGIDWTRVRLLKTIIRDAKKLSDAEQTAIAALHDLAMDGSLAVEPDALLSSLMHMHCNRIGIPMPIERTFVASLWHAWHGLERATGQPSRT
jgi:thiopeptide-type bacteriocin biosynthesis protein